jgi:hypothetical protein
MNATYLWVLVDNEMNGTVLDASVRPKFSKGTLQFLVDVFDQSGGQINVVTSYSNWSNILNGSGHEKRQSMSRDY